MITRRVIMTRDITMNKETKCIAVRHQNSNAVKVKSFTAILPISLLFSLIIGISTSGVASAGESESFKEHEGTEGKVNNFANLEKKPSGSGQQTHPFRRLAGVSSSSFLPFSLAEHFHQTFESFPTKKYMNQNDQHSSVIQMSRRIGVGESGANQNRTLVRIKRSTLTTASCPKGHFACASDTSLCVPQNAICNGKPECPEGDDEDECENIHDKKFWDTFFQKRPGADVGKNDTCKYSRGDEMEPSGCHCSEEKLFCQNLPNLNLSRIPNQVVFLDLSGSGVDSVDFTEQGTRFLQLQTLILSSTNQKEIGQFHLPSLENLHLTGNKLQSIPSKAFSLNKKLKKLFLGYNKISTLHPDSFEGLLELEELDLRHNKLTFVRVDNAGVSYFHALGKLKILHLSYNELELLTPEYFKGLEKLEMLSLTQNRITSIQPKSFENFTMLNHLYLSHNKLEALENYTFCNLHTLLNLNLNHNGIKRISLEAFACLDSLQSLVLEHNKFGEMINPNQIFGNLTNLQYIYFDHFWMCWFAPHVRSCEPKGDGISSVDNLLDNAVLRVCVWIMGLVGVVGNAFVVLSRLVVREKNRVHSFYIKNLAVADLLMGLFLISIASHDVAYRGQFLARQHNWRHSMTCQWSGLLSTFSSEASVLVLTLITLDRYLSIVKPFIERRNDMLPAILIVMVLWIISFFLSYAPMSTIFGSYFASSFYTSNGLCLPLNIHNPFDPGWEYSFVLFVVINTVAFTFICFAYWRMLRIIQMSNTSIRSTQQKQDGMLAMRFGIVVLTDFLCWAPVIIAKTLAMSGVAIQSDFYAWLAVFVLPVNSALNPIIYTLTTKLFKQQVAHLTVGFRKRLGMATDDSTTSSLYYRNRISRTLNTSLNSSMMYSTKGNGSLSHGMQKQSRNRNRYTVSAINSVIASSTGIQLPASTSTHSIAESPEDSNRFTSIPLQTLEENDNDDGVMGAADSAASFPFTTDIDFNGSAHKEFAETRT